MELTPVMKKFALFFVAFNAIQGSATAWQEEEESFPTQGCVDSELEFSVWNSTQGCADVEQNSNKCTNNAFKRYCPVICKSCPDTCEDQAFCNDHNSDDYCKKYWFARDCAITCNFCPTLVPTISPAPSVERGFIMIGEKEGLFRGSRLGFAITMSSDSKEIFVAGRNPKEDRVDILEYSGAEDRLETIISDLNARYKVVLDTSSDGKNLAVAYQMFDEDKLGKVEVYCNQGATWDQAAVFYANSTYYGDHKFGQSLRISDDGKTLLIATNSSVRVYDFNELGWRPNIPILRNAAVVDATMTSDGNIVAVYTTEPSIINVYKWSDKNWEQHGDEITTSVNEAVGLFDNIILADDGKKIFAASSRLHLLRGAIHVFDLQEGNISANTTNTTNSTNGPWRSQEVIRGTDKGDRLGRDMSISRDGQFVAWASNGKVGALKWTGYNWQDEGILLYTHKATVTVDPGGKYLAVGLSNARNEQSSDGKIYLYKWGILSHPSTFPSVMPSVSLSVIPTSTPSSTPSDFPSSKPSVEPSRKPSPTPSVTPTWTPSGTPSDFPSSDPSSAPSKRPSPSPSTAPSSRPSVSPSSNPSTSPSATPTLTPSSTPSASPSVSPSSDPSSMPSSSPSSSPYAVPSRAPSASPSSDPSASPSATPTLTPSSTPSATPSTSPSSDPSSMPSRSPSSSPSSMPSRAPSVSPSSDPSASPSVAPSATPTLTPSSIPSATPSASPSSDPSSMPSSSPSSSPSSMPSSSPSSSPSSTPSSAPSASPSSTPSIIPSAAPSNSPSSDPSSTPSGRPSSSPSAMPSSRPSASPSLDPSTLPSVTPTLTPSSTPSFAPSASPLPMTLVESTYNLANRTAYTSSGDGHVIAIAFISDNTNRVAHFEVYDFPHSDNTQRGAIVSISTTFDITGIAIGMSDDTNTVTIGSFGSDKASVCVFKYGLLAWKEEGDCVPYDQYLGMNVGELTIGHPGRTSYALDEFMHVLVIASISGNDDQIAHFEAYDHPHDTAIAQKGSIVSFSPPFQIVSVAVDMSDDTNTVALGIFGSDKSLVCVFSFKYSAWTQHGSCVSYD